MKKSNVLFELTVENIPYRFIDAAKIQLKDKIEQLMKKSRLEFSEISVYATYRRLVVFIKDVPEKTEKVIEKVYGPSAKLLKDENNKFTKVAEGFARSHKVKPEDLKVEFVEKKGDVIYIERVINSEKAEKILSKVFYEAIKSLEFPKNMIWEESRFVFARPIRNIVALYGSKIIPLEIAGVRSGKVSYSSYFTGFKKIEIKNSDEYFKIMEKRHIIVDDIKRKKSILKIIEGVEEFAKCIVDKDEEVINENLYLCEIPSGVIVKFDSEFLKLPPQLMNLVLKKQLKFFPCYNKKNEMIGVFLGIRDGISRGQKNVENGFLNVFKARCADAMFFYETDLKTNPDVFGEKLKTLIFQKELGTMYEKTLRVKKIVEFIVNNQALEKKEVISACDYIYYDLASNVVNEFSELQGIMNYYYAPKYGINDEELKKAISEIYLPDGLKMPSNIYSAIISISDKIDTLTGNAIIGEMPSGGNDPYGLRRSAIGIFRLFSHYDIKLDILNLIDVSYNLYPEKLREKKTLMEVKKEITEFIYQRIESHFENEQISGDIINSLRGIFLREGNIPDIVKRINAISSLKSRDDFKNIAILYKRLKNILNDFNEDSFNERLFEKEEEKQLAIILKEVEPVIKKYIIEKKYLEGAVEIAKRISGPLEDFFKSVMVMVEDERLKRNRLCLLKRIYNLFNDIADVSQIKY